ncbi:MAG: uroporphyrinogen decarboxylase [Planctomycetota bacterium]|nr:MAG: uroporphyrinogen decarboxylase [Planctomycetota bacterium]
MRDEQWQQLIEVIEGRSIGKAPAGFIIDCPWLSGWAGTSLMEYLTNEELWFETNRRAVTEYPDVWFIPGFWAEYAMCTEPSAFGCRCVWPEEEFPFPEKLIHRFEDVDELTVPDCRKSGLLPFVVKRLHRYRSRIEELGHRIRFATCRGHFNVASYLVGQTELLLAMRTEPERTHTLLDKVTRFLVDWIQYQKEQFPDIEGILVLDDIVGFVGEKDFLEFAKPYLDRIFHAVDVPVRMFHNDAHGMVCAPHLADVGVNIFNFGFAHSLPDMRSALGPNVVMFGNIPPRDVLAGGTPDDVRQAVREAYASIEDKSRIIWSAGGGMPPGVTDENLRAFVDTLSEVSSGA